MTFYVQREKIETAVYEVLHNHGNNFNVIVDSKSIRVYETKNVTETKTTRFVGNKMEVVTVFDYGNPIHEFNDFEGVWIGVTVVDNRYKKDHGHCFLLKESAKSYVYIGYNVYRFTTLSPIKTFESGLVCTYVPQSIAIDSEYFYFLEDTRLKVPRKYTFFPFVYKEDGEEGKEREVQMDAFEVISCDEFYKMLYKLVYSDDEDFMPKMSSDIQKYEEKLDVEMILSGDQYSR